MEERDGVAAQSGRHDVVLTIAPGIIGFEFVVGQSPDPTLIVRDAQHEYVFRGPASRPSN
jgi:hypothetical protein